MNEGSLGYPEYFLLGSFVGGDMVGDWGVLSNLEKKKEKKRKKKGIMNPSS
jgi:hypothetical protein